MALALTKTLTLHNLFLKVRVGFKWGNSFNPNKKSTQSTFLFEKACILYNLGAHESRSASEEDRETEAVRVGSYTS